MLSIAVIYWILIYVVCDANLHMFFITKLLEYNFYVFLTNIVRDISLCKNHYLLDTIALRAAFCRMQVLNPYRRTCLKVFLLWDVFYMLRMIVFAEVSLSLAKKNVRSCLCQV